MAKRSKSCSGIELQAMALRPGSWLCVKLRICGKTVRVKARVCFVSPQAVAVEWSGNKALGLVHGVFSRSTGAGVMLVPALSYAAKWTPQHGAHVEQRIAPATEAVIVGAWP